MGKKKQEWLKTVIFVVVKISYLWHKLGQSQGKEINKRGNKKAKKGLNRSLPRRPLGDSRRQDVNGPNKVKEIKANNPKTLG